MVARKKFSIFIFLLLCFASGKAQRGSEKVKSELDSFSKYVDKDLDAACYYIKRAYANSIVLKKDSLLARTAYNLSYYYYLKNNIDSSKIYLKKGFEYSKKSNFKKIVSLCYLQAGTIAVDENQFEKALKLYLMALDIAEKNDLYKNKSRVLINLGNLSVRQKDTLIALEYYRQSINNAQKYSLNNELIGSYNNTAILYASSNQNRAANYYNKALVIAQKDKNLYEQYNLHINLSDLYVRYKNERARKQVFYHLQKAKFIQQKLHDSSLLFFLNFNFGGYHKNKKQFSRAIEYYKKALNMVNINTPSNQILNLYYSLSDAYAQNKDYKNALLIKEKQNKLSENIFSIKKNKAFNDIQTKYEVDKKNLKIQLLIQDKAIQSRKKQVLLIIGGMIIVFLLIILLFYKQRVKTQKIIADNENKIHAQEVARLENENELKRILGLVEGQDQERNRLAQDIHDGIGGTLAGIKLELSQVNSLLKNSKIESVIVKMQTAFNDLRLISHDLSVSSLKEREFDFLLNKLKEEYKSRGEFNTDIHIFPQNAMNEISNNLRYQLYRVIQELFTNTSKHAKATQVVLSCTVFEEQINVIFEDNGNGFDASKETGIGLKNVRERLLLVDATITIESNQGKGTTVIIDIPLYEN